MILFEEGLIFKGYFLEGGLFFIGGKEVAPIREN